MVLRVDEIPPSPLVCASVQVSYDSSGDPGIFLEACGRVLGVVASLSVLCTPHPTKGRDLRGLFTHGF